MYICVKCQREMRCLKNGVGANFGHGHVYPGDMFQCPKCGDKILATNAKAISDPNYKTQDEYLKINEKGHEKC